MIKLLLINYYYIRQKFVQLLLIEWLENHLLHCVYCPQAEHSMYMVVLTPDRDGSLSLH